MADLLRHRGPDDEGVWVDAEAGIALAQRRLSVVDLSPAGHQPMISACQRYVLVFNGEIYNCEQMRQKLDAEAAHTWRGHSDTEVLLEAIARWGLLRALECAAGMFALALWDRRERTLALARDRLGEKPLYYGRVGNSFVFASELKAFRAHPSWNPQVNRDAIALLMRHNCVPAPYSIYKGCYKLRPGHVLVLGTGAREPRVEAYWSARVASERAKAHAFDGSREEAVAALEQVLKQSIKGQMMGDVPVGAFLSGGIDSSTVVALMQSISTQPVRTFTIGFHDARYNEAEHARQVARHLGTDHTELYVTEREAIDVIPALPHIYCEPFSDSSQIPTFLVAKLARQNVTVSLSGDGGDELFSGYNRYSVADAFWRKMSRVPQALRRAAAGLATLPPPAFYDRLAWPLLPQRYRLGRVGDRVHEGARLFSTANPDDLFLHLRSHWADPASIVPGSNEPPTMLTGLDALPSLPSDVERMMYLDLLSYLPDDILVKVDRAAMAVSLETRAPMLDHRVVEFAMSLPLAVLRADNTTKWPLRQLLHKVVPSELIDRPKKGFEVPIDTWLRGALRDWSEDLLSEARLKADGFFDPAPIRLAWRDHLSGRRELHHPLWDVLMFQAWYAAQKDVQPALAA